VILGCDQLFIISFRDVILPYLHHSELNVHTNLLDCHPLQLDTVLRNRLFSSLYMYKERQVEYLNPLQSQMFHVLYHRNQHVLVGAPTGSGKTMVAELAILRLLRQSYDYDGVAATIDNNNNGDGTAG